MSGLPLKNASKPDAFSVCDCLFLTTVKGSQDSNDPIHYAAGNADPVSIFDQAGSMYAEVEDEGGRSEDTETKKPRAITRKRMQQQKLHHKNLHLLAIRTYNSPQPSISSIPQAQSKNIR